MKKPLLLALAAIVIVVGGLAGIKTLQIRRMIDQKSKFAMPPEVVSSTATRTEKWGTTLTAVGTLAAVQGVNVAAELPGKVVHIGFAPGARVAAGTPLLRQDTSTEETQLRSAQTAADLAKTTLERYRGLLAGNSIARSVFDNAEAQYQQSTSQVDTIRALIAKKNIRAPFTGRLGVRLVNLGQILKEGDPIVSLQTLDPIFINFSLPQQQLPLVRTGLTVQLAGNGGRVMEGKITTINPQVDAATRTIGLQATVANPDEQLRPGMFVDLAVVLPELREVRVIPTTAVLFAPYSDSVYVIEEKKDEKTGKSGKVLRQQFIRLGEKRGDFVAVASGLKAGDTVVSTGVFKLRNGQAVVVDNALAPAFNLAPRPENE